ncbi:PAS domain-containing sensor histidine kinase [Pseudodesulfovibrio tunisiensis]|uniref:PAS domain-containing sensor histidine kinase n=1 Tax=Pseudodesulfovibrio tunisiensis TaxID=463192 RepID=UPI001FB502A5|nr:PAS domain-containing sensor histidine kinase [Pseudodesulfovibrio tunisiensis]
MARQIRKRKTHDPAFPDRSDALSESARECVTHCPISVLITDDQGRIQYANPSFLRASGLKLSEVLDRPCGQPFRTAIPDRALEAVRSGKTWQGEVAPARGRSAPHERVTVVPVADEPGRTTHCILFREDISEKKRLEHLETDIAALVRRDVRSPIMAFFQIPAALRRADNITPEQAEALAGLEEAAYSLVGELNLALDLFRMEQAAYQVRPEALNLLRIIRSVLRDLTADMHQCGVGAVLTFRNQHVGNGDCLAVRGEELLCYSLFANLIRNAIEASPCGGKVVIDCQDGDPGTVDIHNPEPVPRPLRDCFFDKYATAGKAFGAGLGTYSARLIARTLDGDVTMSTSDRDGTHVTVSLPRA